MLGKRVVWRSQARGTWKEKRGVVVYFRDDSWARKRLLSTDYVRQRGFTDYWLDADAFDDFRAARTRDRMDNVGELIVRVERTGKKGQALPPLYYSPKRMNVIEAS